MGVMTMPLWRVLELQRDTYDPEADTPHPESGYTVGLKNYPIFDEDERPRVNALILENFWNREIGAETIDMFRYYIRRTMRQIMPTYNQLYLSQKFVFDPLSTYDLGTVRNGTVSETSSSDQESGTTGTGHSESRSVYFDTPQTALARNKDYAANATDVESDSENSGTSTATSSGTTDATNSDSSTTTGRQGSANRLLAEYRANIINTDLMLLNDPDLVTCFHLIWETGDEILVPQHLPRLGRL